MKALTLVFITGYLFSAAQTEAAGLRCINLFLSETTQTLSPWMIPNKLTAGRYDSQDATLQVTFKETQYPYANLVVKNTKDNSTFLTKQYNKHTTADWLKTTYSTNLERLMVTGEDRETGDIVADIYDTKSGQLLGSYPMRKANMSTDGKTLVILESDQTESDKKVKAYDIDTGKMIWGLKKTFLGYYEDAKTNHDGSQVIVTRRNSSDVYDINTGEKLYSLPAGGTAYSPNGKYILLSGAKSVSMLDARFGAADGAVIIEAQIKDVLNYNSSPVFSPSFGLREGQVMIRYTTGATIDRTVRIDMNTRRITYAEDKPGVFRL